MQELRPAKTFLLTFLVYIRLQTSNHWNRSWLRHNVPSIYIYVTWSDNCNGRSTINCCYTFDKYFVPDCSFWCRFGFCEEGAHDENGDTNSHCLSLSYHIKFTLLSFMKCYKSAPLFWYCYPRFYLPTDANDCVFVLKDEWVSLSALSNQLSPARRFSSLRVFIFHTRITDV